MKRILASIFLGILFATPVFSQDILEIKRVDTDSLITVLRNEFGQKIYYIHNEKDQNTYTVTALRNNFVNAALDQIQQKGYTVSRYDGALFVTTGLAINSKLPTGYFTEQTKEPDIEYSEYLKDEVEAANFANKVYEIGEKREGRTGKARVSGYVSDAATGEPIIGVSVVDEKTGTYSITDTYGFYNISVPVGEGSLVFNGYSLEEMALKLLVYDDGSLNVIMHEKVNSLKEAVVTAETNTAHREPAMGVERMRVNVITKVPVAFGEGDVLKVVTTLPGVKSVGEASSGFNVRGGSVDQNLILFNDGTVYNPSHMFGIFSAFNTEVINDVQLYKSSIPAEFGGRISSVLDIKSREGNSNKLEGSVGIGLLTSRFHLEGPLKKGKTTFLIGGRTTYSNWIMKLLPKKNSNYSGGKSQFYDLNASVSHKFNDHNSLHFYGYYSRDKFSFSGDTTFRYSNLNASLKWRNNFSQNHGVVLTAGYDQYENILDNGVNYYEAYQFKSFVRQAYAKVNFKSVVGENHTFKYGFQAINYLMSPGIKNPQSDTSAIVSQNLGLDPAIELAAYFGDVWQMGDKFSIDYGLRFSGFTNIKKPKFYGMPELRLAAKYSITPALSIKAGVNSMRQYIHLVTNTSSISPMDTWKVCDADIKPQDGWQGAGGIYWTIGNNLLDLSVEGYFKQVWNYLDYKSGATLMMNDHLADVLVPTRSKAYGVEFMLKKPNGKLNGWISYTYSRVLLQEMQDRGMQTINGGSWYPAAHDKPHDLKVVANYKFTHRYSISGNLDYSTGRPVTIPTGKYYYGGGLRLDYSDRNAYRIPDYFRLDLAFNIDPGHYLKAIAHTVITFGVYNVTGHKNAYSVYYTAHGGSQVNGYMLSVFAVPVPYVNINLKF